MPAVGPLEDLVGVFPVLVEGLALVGEDGDAGGGDGGGGMILGREDVARGPADLGAEGLERLDQDGRLDGHVERAGDACALEGLARGILLADGHEAGHLGLGDGDLAAAPGGERDVGDVVIAGQWRAFAQRRSRSKSPETMNGRRCTVIIHPSEPGRNAHAYRRSAPRWDGVGLLTLGKPPWKNHFPNPFIHSKTSRSEARRRKTGSGGPPEATLKKDIEAVRSLAIPQAIGSLSSEKSRPLGSIRSSRRPYIDRDAHHMGLKGGNPESLRPQGLEPLDRRVERLVLLAEAKQNIGSPYWRNCRASNRVME